jgi:hypothetical protein
MFGKICRLLQVCLSSNIMLHLAARYQVGDLSFSPILEIGPSPTATTPGWLRLAELRRPIKQGCHITSVGVPSCVLGQPLVPMTFSQVALLVL